MTDRELHRSGDCRHATLRALHARQGLALRLVAVEQALASDGYDFAASEIAAALGYLAGDGLVKSSTARLSALPVHEITTEGIRFIERGSA